jgi:hypothetical protein
MHVWGHVSYHGRCTWIMTTTTAMRRGEEEAWRGWVG